jgi:hypothetical protein
MTPPATNNLQTTIRLSITLNNTCHDETLISGLEVVSNKVYLATQFYPHKYQTPPLIIH